MHKHALALAATAAALATTTAPMPAAAQGLNLGNMFTCPNGNNGGAIAGALLGGLAGSQVSKNERTLGAVAGAALGAWAGNKMACNMNASSRTQAQNAFQRTLDTGRSQSWYDSRTGARGEIEVVSNGYDRTPYAGQYSRPVATGDLRYARGVQRIYNDLRPAAPVYVAPGRVNVRAAPTTNAPVVNRLRAGQELRVAGLVSGGWLAVEEDGWVQGYVSAASVRPASGMNYASGPGRGCRVVQQTITMRGYPTETQRFNACRDRAGAWELNPI